MKKPCKNEYKSGLLDFLMTFLWNERKKSGSCITGKMIKWTLLLFLVLLLSESKKSLSAVSFCLKYSRLYPSSVTYLLLMQSLCPPHIIPLPHTEISSSVRWHQYSQPTLRDKISHKKIFLSISSLLLNQQIHYAVTILQELLKSRKHAMMMEQRRPSGSGGGGCCISLFFFPPQEKINSPKSTFNLHTRGYAEVLST